MAVFGSSPWLVDSAVSSVCSSLKVPYLTTQPLMISDSPVTGAVSSDSHKFAVHLGPGQNDIINAVSDLIGELEWSEFALISHRETGKEI